MPFRACASISRRRCGWRKPSGTSCLRGASTPLRWPPRKPSSRIPRTLRHKPRRRTPNAVRSDAALSSLPGIERFTLRRQLRSVPLARRAPQSARHPPQMLRHRRPRLLQLPRLKDGSWFRCRRPLPEDHRCLAEALPHPGNDARTSPPTSAPCFTQTQQRMEIQPRLCLNTTPFAGFPPPP